MNLVEIGRFLIVAGSMIIVLGLFFALHDKVPLGRMTGDLQFNFGRVKVYIPLATSILVSAALTITFNLFARKI